MKSTVHCAICKSVTRIVVDREAQEMNGHAPLYCVVCGAKAVPLDEPRLSGFSTPEYLPAD